MLTWSIPQFKTCSLYTKYAVFMQKKLMPHEIITKGHTGLSIRYNRYDSLLLSVLNITSCIHLEDHYYVLGLINVCKQLPPLKIFEIKWSYGFFPWVHTGDLNWLESFRVSNDNIKLGVTSIGQNIQSVKHCKASRMHHLPKINETELLCNTLMLKKYFDFNLSCSQIHIFLFT